MEARRTLPYPLRRAQRRDESSYSTGRMSFFQDVYSRDYALNSVLDQPFMEPEDL
jgi:hypothetical protein